MAQKIAIGRDGAIPHLVALCSTGTSAARERAAGALRDLCATGVLARVWRCVRGPGRAPLHARACDVCPRVRSCREPCAGGGGGRGRCVDGAARFRVDLTRGGGRRSTMESVRRVSAGQARLLTIPLLQVHL